MKKIIFISLFITSTMLAQTTDLFVNNVNKNSDSSYSANFSKKSAIKSDSSEIIITIAPQGAINANVTLIKRSEVMPSQGPGYASRVIEPDTIVIQKAPVLKLLSPGQYDIIVNKEKYKSYKGSFVLLKDKTELGINLIPYSYIDVKKSEWSKYKWISAGIATVAGIAAIYFKNKLHSYISDYNNAVTYDATIDSHNKIVNYQTFYKISSGVSLSAIAACVISWFTEIVIFRY